VEKSERQPREKLGKASIGLENYDHLTARPKSGPRRHTSCFREFVFESAIFKRRKNGSLLGNFRDIVTRLEKQKVAIDQPIVALRAFDDGDVAASETLKTDRPRKAAKKATKKRVMSEEGRRRIAEASRKNAKKGA
jgi:hypothetical protein